MWRQRRTGPGLRNRIGQGRSRTGDRSTYRGSAAGCGRDTGRDSNRASALGGCRRHDRRGARACICGPSGVRHRRDQCRWPAAGRLPQLGARYLAGSAGRQYAGTDRHHPPAGRRHDGTRLRSHRQHHIQCGESAGRWSGPVHRCPQRADRICGRAGTHDGSQRRDDQQPAARHFRDCATGGQLRGAGAT